MNALAPLLTPHGRLTLESAEDALLLAEDVAGRLSAAFASGHGHGLLQLGAGEVKTALPRGCWRGLRLMKETVFLEIAERGRGLRRGHAPVYPSQRGLWLQRYTYPVHQLNSKIFTAAGNAAFHQLFS